MMDQTSMDAGIQSLPLQGVVACLSGINHDEKERLHDLVESLGGRYTRELRPDQVTHLIVLEPNGPKYDAAAQFPKRISIVSPAWLDASAKARQRIDEEEFLFQKNPSKRKLSEMEHGVDDISSRIEDLLAPGGNDSTLFSKAFFHLVGWDCTDKEHRAISLLIRRFWGTIMWEMSDEAITHVIAKDDALDEPTRREISRRKEVIIVSPPWLITSCEQGSMADAFRFPPKLGVAPTIKKDKVEASVPIFEGKVFYILEDQLSDEFVTFSASELSQRIVDQAGQLLTQTTKEVLLHDKEAKGAVAAVYVVRWGNSKSDAFLDEMTQNRDVTYTLHEVTPIWLTACIELRSWVAPGKVARLFQPLGTPWRRIDDSSSTRLSITGFTGAERIALVHFIKALGATYDDSMSKRTLYLICAKESGPKYEKAIEWNVQVVDVNWLYELAHG